MNDEHPTVRYEPKDVRLGCLLAVMAVTILVLATVGFVVWRFFWFEAGVQKAMKRSPYPLAPGPSTQLPPEPRLEQLDRLAGVAGVEVNERLAAQEEILNSFGPTDEKGFVHIPIRQAIKAVAGTLPVRKQPQRETKEDSGLLDSGEPNSGRMFRGE